MRRSGSDAGGPTLKHWEEFFPAFGTAPTAGREKIRRATNRPLP